jgi:Uma2 family endonuclease
MNQALHKPWTQQEFFAWAEEQDEPYEFDGFEPVAMTGGTTRTDAIGINLTTALSTRLRVGPCRPLGPNAGVETINNKIRYPDALITCTRLGPRDHKTPDVRVVFEIVSQTSGHRDRNIKPIEYAAVPSILRYVIIESSRAELTVHQRAHGHERWHTLPPLAIYDVLRIPEVDIEIPVNELYARIDFSDDADQ